MHAGGFESKKWRYPKSCLRPQSVFTYYSHHVIRSVMHTGHFTSGRCFSIPRSTCYLRCARVGPPQAQGEGGEATAAHMHADVAHSLQLARTDRRSARCACPPRSPFRLRFLREASVELRTLFSTAVDSSLIAPSASPGVVPPPP